MNIVIKAHFALLAIVLSFTGLTTVFAQADSITRKPNIVLILVDDAGLMEFGAYGGEAHTPTIDSLARQGLMFTNMHASPTCAPSRAMLLTGTDSHLAGVANLPEMLPKEYLDKPGYGGVLNDRVQTIATRLKAVNYNTYVAGKWHLGNDEKTLPSVRGFDRSFILGASGGSNYDSRGYLPQKPHAHWYEDGREVELPADFYSSKTYIDKIISFHEKEKNTGNAFFTYIPFQAIHVPIQAPREFVERYRTMYKEGWDVLRLQRFEKAKQLNLIPASAELNDVFPDFRKWGDLTQEEQNEYATGMSVKAGMLEAMDYHVSRYIAYLNEKGLLENTIFIVTSDNGPDGGDYSPAVRWALNNGYHRDFDKNGGKGYYGYFGEEFANALSSPFSFFKYYTGEGGLRVPLIFSGKNMPKSAVTGEFSFFTDIAPTIYELVGISTSANSGFAPITGKSLLSHIKDPTKRVYGSNDGVGLEAGNSCAYFLDGYKIVKNNIPHGDNQWHLYHIQSDPGEVKDLATQQPERFAKMLDAYENYARAVGVIRMPEGYSVQGEVKKNAIKSMILGLLPYLILVVVTISAGTIYFIRRRKKANQVRSGN